MRELTRSERLADMLMYVQEKKIFHLRDIMDKYGVSNRTAKRDVHALKKSGLKIHSTSGFNGRCQVINDESMYCVFLSRKDIETLYLAMVSINANGEVSNDSGVELLMDKLKKLSLGEDAL